MMNIKHGKWIEMQFSDKPPGKKIPAGVKYVLFKITDPEGLATYDWGMSEWDLKDWGLPEVPEGYSCEVAWWSEPLHPHILLKGEKKIISLNGN